MAQARFPKTLTPLPSTDTHLVLYPIVATSSEPNACPYRPRFCRTRRISSPWPACEWLKPIDLLSRKEGNGSGSPDSFLPPYCSNPGSLVHHLIHSLWLYLSTKSIVVRSNEYFVAVTSSWTWPNTCFGSWFKFYLINNHEAHDTVVIICGWLRSKRKDISASAGWQEQALVSVTGKTYDKGKAYWPTSPLIVACSPRFIHPDTY